MSHRAASKTSVWRSGGGLLCVEPVHAGRLSFRTAGEELYTVALDVRLVPPHELWRATSQEFDLAPLTPDRAQVAAHAADVGGIEPDALRFTGLLPISPPKARYWNATVTHIREEVLGQSRRRSRPLRFVTTRSARWRPRC